MNHPSPRILIVDDQTSIRRTMTGIIEDLGFQVLNAEDGYRAIDEVKSTRFDLVFLDIKMPGINGVQTFREIKKLSPNILVVMMTGFDLSELIDESLDEGAMCVVYKPFGPEQIINLLRSAHEPCPAKLPTNIGALVGQIQSQIDEVVQGSAVARVTVRIPDYELRALRLLATSGLAAGFTRTLCSPASLSGLAFYSNEVQVINDYQSHLLGSESENELEIGSALAVPIRCESNLTLGSVAVSCYDADYFSPEIVETFLGLAREIGNLMESASPAEAEFLNGLNALGFSTVKELINVQH